MAIAVVDILEMVEVADDDAQRTPLTSGAGQFAGEKLNGGAAIHETGEGIMSGLFVQGVARGDEFVLHGEDTFASAEARAKFIGVERLGKIVVGAGIQAVEQILFLAAGREEQQVNIGAPGALADAAADFYAL